MRMRTTGPLDPNAYSYTRGLIHTFRLAVLIHAHLLEWRFLLARSPAPSSEAPGMDDDASIRSDLLFETSDSLLPNSEPLCDDGQT